MRSVLFLFFLLVFTSFRTPSVTDEQKRIAILTSGKWLMADSYAQYNVNGTIVKRSRWHLLDSCFKDNIMVFGKTGRLYYDQGKLMCKPFPSRVDSSFKWRLDNSSNLIWLDGQVFVQALFIEYISDSVLEVNEHYVFGDSAFIKVYKHLK